MSFKKSEDAAEPKYSGGVKKTLINLLVTVVFGLVYYYVKLPAINLQNKDFYFFFFLLAAVYCCMAILTSGIWKLRGEGEFFSSVKNHCKAPLIVCAAFLVMIIVGSLLSSVVFRARAYSRLLPFETGTFAEDIKEVDYNQIPMLDKSSAQMLGTRKLGELSDMVSQFEVSSENTQINYKGRPVRVAPLVYGDLIKWFNNRSNGLPAYIMVDMVTQNAEVVRLTNGGIRYTTGEHFMRYLPRYLRFRYPTFMFDTPTFEIDEQGDPYWICPRIVKTIGLFGGTDIDGAVLVNAVTGECQYYDAADVPTWVDRVYTAELIIAQYDYYGQYHNGFLNSMFGQKDVTVTTDGYNYIAMDDDVYVYTGVTSVGGDESNVGFILCNQRTKETRFYRVPGAEEYSAMSSAQGVVQHLNYTATFPLLLNINGQPTYFMALKDAAGLVKMYAMVNVGQYNIVSTGSTVAECQQSYKKLLAQNNIAQSGAAEEGRAAGVIAEKREAVLSGNTFYYIRLEGEERYYAVSAADSQTCVIVNVGDTVEIGYDGSQTGDIVAATSLTLTARAEASAPQTPAESAPEAQPESPSSESASSESASSAG